MLKHQGLEGVFLNLHPEGVSNTTRKSQIKNLQGFESIFLTYHPEPKKNQWETYRKYGKKNVFQPYRIGS